MKIPKTGTASKDEECLKRDVRMLPERWTEVMASDGHYFECAVMCRVFHNQFIICDRKRRELTCAPNTFNRDTCKTKAYVEAE